MGPAANTNVMTAEQRFLQQSLASSQPLLGPAVRPDDFILNALMAYGMPYQVSLPVSMTHVQLCQHESRLLVLLPS